MTAEARPAKAEIRPGGLDPLRLTWQLLTNVKFALFLVGLALLAGLAGVVLPQMPGPMRGNPAARQAWLELQRQDFGAFTDLMNSLGLFDVFHTAWFNGLWVVIIIAVTVCTVSRLRPTIRGVRRPPKTVGDGYFERAHHRADFSHPGGVDAIEASLRKRRYHVERTKSAGGTTYLFADRFAWSQYGTFLSHLALLMLLIGALLTKVAGFDRTFVIAETTPAAPVFDTPGPGQIFVRVVDAVRGMDSSGNLVDYRSKVEVRRGDRTVTCTTTVNDPCSAFGYKIHQAAFFDDIARLHITGPGGRLVYDDVLDFNNEITSVPVMEVLDGAGNVLFNQELPQMGTDPGTKPGPEDDLGLAALNFPAAPGSTSLASYLVAWRVERGKMLLTVSGDNFGPIALNPGDTASDAGYQFRFVTAHAIPAIRVNDMPGAISGDGSAIVQMPTGGDGKPYLFVTGVDAKNVTLQEDAPAQEANGYTYTFGGRLEASGLSVRRDPGSTFIWVAVGMATIGLALTFYVPRRRLWVKVTPTRTYLAGIAERTTRFSRELRLLGHELGSKDALQPGDTLREE